MENWKSYIASKPEVMYGKPVIKGTRISVDLILEKMSYGETIDSLLESYPYLSREAVLACLSFAADKTKNEKVYSVA